MMEATGRITKMVAQQQVWDCEGQGYAEAAHAGGLLEPPKVDPVDMAPDPEPVPAPLLSVPVDPAPLDRDPPELQQLPCLPPATPSAAAAAEASWLSVASLAWSIHDERSHRQAAQQMPARLPPCHL